MTRKIMGVQTLEELKEENAASETETEQVTLTDPDEVEGVEVASEDEPEPEIEESGPSKDGEEDAEPELWMQSEEQNSQDRLFTSSDIAAAKRKLKAKVAKRDDEIAELRAEVQALKAGPPSGGGEAKPRPKLEDFAYDEEKYAQAMEDWLDSRLDAKVANYQQKAQQTDHEQSQQKQMTQAVDQHYERAAKLVNEGLITSEAYHNADELIRRQLDTVSPGGGDQLADSLIAMLDGEGSEKVWYHLGRNTQALGTLKDKLMSDPTGLKAMSYLGALSARLTTPKPRQSNAPKPGKDVKGDLDDKPSAAALKRRYEKAVKSGDVQNRINIRRQAKAEGHDISTWS